VCYSLSVLDLAFWDYFAINPKKVKRIRLTTRELLRSKYCDHRIKSFRSYHYLLTVLGLGFLSLGPFHCARFIFVLCITVCCMHDCLGL